METKKREIIEGCEDIIYKMRDCAKDLISKGDDSGLLALYWINKWIKDKPTCGDEDYNIETGKHRPVPLYVHPGNFDWAFIAYTDLDTDSYAFAAIEKVYELCGGK